MHASSFENMQICFDQHVAVAGYMSQDEVLVADIGGADVNGGYRPIFSDPKFRYLTIDLEAGPGVDIALDDPYKLPFDDASVDIVLSGQMLEHCEFFWQTFAEMVRVLKPEGHIILIAPSAGPIHKYPVDCYRFYPDAYQALAKYTHCFLHACWLDERGPWRDLVGIFSKMPADADRIVRIAPFSPQTYDTATSSDAPDEQAIAGVRPYIDVLADLHQTLAPGLYLEIGVRMGRSLALAKTAVGVDPAPEVTEPLSPDTRVMAMTSDHFFLHEAAKVLTSPPDLVFIDGMHLFEYALRDFMNVERIASPNTVVVIDDIFPNHPAQAARNRHTRVWMGDVWKLHALLAEKRPDLLLLPLDTAPSGLLLVAGLNPENRVLWDQYNPLVRRFRQSDDVPPEVLARQGAVAPDFASVDAALNAMPDRPGVDAALLARLRAVFARQA